MSKSDNLLCINDDIINKSFSFENKQIRTVIIGEEIWFCGKDVAGILGYSKERNAISNHVDNDDKMSLNELILIERGGKMAGIKKYNKNELNAYFINKDVLISLLTACRLTNKSDFIRFCYDKLNISYNIITTLTKEQETIGCILKIFNYENMKCQYIVSAYRIDLYFIDKKLAIECDEFGHKDRNPVYEKNRETYIKQNLNCHFIRYNPDSIDFSIINVISDINHYLYSH